MYDIGENLEKNVEISLLFDFYKNLLTDRQTECIDLYYNEDLSLGEMADMMGISRQGVRDNIMRGVQTLHRSEEKLGLAARFLSIRSDLERIDDIIRDIEASPENRTLSDNMKHKINDILMIINEINGMY